MICIEFFSVTSTGHRLTMRDVGSTDGGRCWLLLKL